MSSQKVMSASGNRQSLYTFQTSRGSPFRRPVGNGGIRKLSHITTFPAGGKALITLSTCSDLSARKISTSVKVLFLLLKEMTERIEPPPSHPPLKSPYNLSSPRFCKATQRWTDWCLCLIRHTLKITNNSSTSIYQTGRINRPNPHVLYPFGDTSKKSPFHSTCTSVDRPASSIPFTLSPYRKGTLLPRRKNITPAPDIRTAPPNLKRSRL